MNCTAYIEKVIQEFDKVILAADDFTEILEQTDFDALDFGGRRILVLSESPCHIKGKAFSCEVLSGELAKELRRLYHTYEFTDNFILLEKNCRFAGVFDLTESGVLSTEEAWQALLM